MSQVVHNVMCTAYTAHGTRRQCVCGEWFDTLEEFAKHANLDINTTGKTQIVCPTCGTLIASEG